MQGHGNTKQHGTHEIAKARWVGLWLDVQSLMDGSREVALSEALSGLCRGELEGRGGRRDTTGKGHGNGPGIQARIEPRPGTS